MSTAFSDFGPLTERRRVEKQRQQRRRVMVAAAGASVVLILIVMGAAAVAYNASVQDDDVDTSSSSPSSPSSSGGSGSSSLLSVSKSVKMMCAQTDYKDACEKSLTKVATANASTTSSPKDMVRAAVSVIGDAVAKAFERSALVASTTGNKDPRVKAAVADCKEIYGNARDDLARTLRGIDAGGMGEVTGAGTSSGAVIAHMETCIDGFPDGELKRNMTGAMESGKELTSNALAIIEKATSFLAALHITGFTGATTSHRRLFGVHEEEDMEKQPKVNYSGTFEQADRDGDSPAPTSRRLLGVEDEDAPPWVNGEERRMLKGNFQGRLTPTVVVAKDGSGKFNTINEALKAMPPKYTGRYLIYVKAGVYEEYVTITKAMENVTMYGEGAMKTIITGSRNFADGLTTYKTATFNAQGDGFIGIALGFRNTAGAAKHQAVALLDASGRPAIRSYLARPWREFSRTLIMESEIPAFIDKAGYLPWNGDFGLKTLWYAEYANRGPGADIAGRVNWPGYKKVISKEEATQFTVQNFLHAEPWLKPAGAPVKYGFWA
nr:unnamed protein product [Digitaria exilis]